MIWVIVAFVNSVCAIAFGLAARATSRSRKGAVAFMGSATPLPMIALACGALVVWPIVSLIPILISKPKIDPWLFAFTLAAMSAAAITLILFLQAKYVNRNASIWLRFVAPSTIVTQEGEEENTLSVSPGSVTAVLVEEAYGMIVAQYQVHDGERVIQFAVPISLVAMKKMQDLPWSSARSAPIMVGGDGGAVHEFLAPHRASHSAH